MGFREIFCCSCLNARNVVICLYVYRNGLTERGIKRIIVGVTSVSRGEVIGTLVEELVVDINMFSLFIVIGVKIDLVGIDIDICYIRRRKRVDFFF